MHDDEDYRLTARAAGYGVMMAEVPGDRDGGGGGARNATDGNGQAVSRVAVR
jgi:hypothetical protein